MIRTVKSGNFGHLSVSGGTFNLEGNIISPENFNKFKNEEEIKKKFKISENEIENIENGLERAIYNRLSIKDLK